MVVLDTSGMPSFSKYRISNDTHLGYKDQDLYIVPLENNTTDHFDKAFYTSETIGILNTKGVLINAFGEYPSTYQSNILPYRTVPSLAIDSNRKRIYSGFAASESIAVYDYEGNLQSTFGEVGGEIERQNFPSINQMDQEKWATYWHAAPVYNSMYFDEERQLLYRIYAEDTPENQAKALGNLLHKKAYLQIYRDEILLQEMALPQDFRWKILDIDEDGHLVFASKFYHDGPEEQQTWIYKVMLDED